MLGAAVRWHAFTTIPMPGHQGVNLPYLAMPDLLPSLDLGCCGVAADAEGRHGAGNRRGGGRGRHAAAGAQSGRPAAAGHRRGPGAGGALRRESGAWSAVRLPGGGRLDRPRCRHLRRLLRRDDSQSRPAQRPHRDDGSVSGRDRKPGRCAGRRDGAGRLRRGRRLLPERLLDARPDPAPADRAARLPAERAARHQPAGQRRAGPPAALGARPGRPIRERSGSPARC